MLFVSITFKFYGRHTLMYSFQNVFKKTHIYIFVGTIRLSTFVTFMCAIEHILRITKNTTKKATCNRIILRMSQWRSQDFIWEGG